MHAIIVGRDKELMQPLAERLDREKFKVALVDNSAAVQAHLKRGAIDFLLAEPGLLLDHNLAREVSRRCPLARLLALASQPTLLGMADALASGLTDYFPRRPEYFDQIVEIMRLERMRMTRWQKTFLSPRPLGFISPANE